MQINLRFAIWNANGLPNHKEEIETFININHIDIFLIFEKHFTNRTYFNINGFDLIPCNHPENRAHGGSAILVKRSIKYTILDDYQKPHLQAAGIRINCNNNDISIYSIYLPPSHNVKYDDYIKTFLKRLVQNSLLAAILMPNILGGVPDLPTQREKNFIKM